MPSLGSSDLPENGTERLEEMIRREYLGMWWFEVADHIHLVDIFVQRALSRNADIGRIAACPLTPVLLQHSTNSPWSVCACVCMFVCSHQNKIREWLTRTNSIFVICLLKTHTQAVCRPRCAARWSGSIIHPSVSSLCLLQQRPSSSLLPAIFPAGISQPLQTLFSKYLATNWVFATLWHWQVTTACSCNTFNLTNSTFMPTNGAFKIYKTNDGGFAISFRSADSVIFKKQKVA